MTTLYASTTSTVWPARAAISIACFLLVLVLFLAPGLAYAQQAGGKTQVLADYGRLPLGFEVNRGQTGDQVKFVSHGPGFSLFLTPTEAVLVLSNPRTLLTNALHIKLVGANPEPNIQGLEELASKSNYFIGNDPGKWQTDVPNYAKVRYVSVYPGVDLAYYGNQRQLEHDFIVSPGADPRAITLGLDKKERLSIDEHGDLVMRNEAGEVRLRKPVVYQEVAGIRRQVAGGYVLKSQHHVGFRVGKYDLTRTLVIDPVLSYATYLNGTYAANEYGTGIAVDSAGSAYVTGKTDSGTFPTTTGAFQTTSTYGPLKAFVMKLTADGSGLVYSTYLGGTSANGDYGQAIAVDSAGSAYVTGVASSADFPTTPGAVQTTLNGAPSKPFVTKLNATGSALVYSTYLGGTAGDTSYGIAVDSAGSAYVAGRTPSNNFPVTTGALRTVNTWPSGLVTKLNPAGSGLIYSTYLGSNTYSDSCNAIAVDSAGFAYVTGSTYTYPNGTGSSFPVTSGAFQTASPLESPTAFVAKMSSDGSALIYSTFLGGHGAFSPLGIGGESGQGIAVDSAGSAYVTGTTYSPDFPTTAGAFQTTFSGAGGDAFAAKLNPAGSGLIYSTFLGGSTYSRSNALDPPHAIALDSAGSAYVTGTTNSATFPTTAGALQTVFGGVADAFVTELRPDGSGLVYSTYLGGNNYEWGLGIALDPAGSVYVTGFTNSFNFPITAGAFQTTQNSVGNGTGFVAKLASTQGSTTTKLASSSNPSVFGQNVTLTATVTPAAAITATDTVTFYDGATSLGSIALTGTQATLSTSTLLAGTHFITASYTGNTNNTGSSSPALTQTVNKASSTTTLASSTNPSVPGQTVTLTATIAVQTNSTATGSVTFADSVVGNLGRVNVAGNIATLSTTALVFIGSDSITATYSGDSNVLASTSAALTQNVVAPLVTTTTLVSSLNPSYMTQPVTFTATVMASNGTPATGTVTFQQGTSAVSKSLVGGVATYAVTFSTAGSSTVTAVYPATGIYLASTSAPLTQRVLGLPAATKIVVASSGTRLVVGQAVTLTATVYPPFGTVPDGELITFSDSATHIGTATTSGGVATLTFSSGLTGGVHPIGASYPGDATYAPSIARTITLIVKYGTTTTLTSSPNPSAYGQTMTFTATVTSTGPKVPTGSVSFMDGSTNLATASLNASGVATFTRAYLFPGKHSITANYQGDSQSAASSGALTQVVNPPVIRR